MQMVCREDYRVCFKDFFFSFFNLIRPDLFFHFLTRVSLAQVVSSTEGRAIWVKPQSCPNMPLSHRCQAEPRFCKSQFGRQQYQQDQPQEGLWELCPGCWQGARTAASQQPKPASGARADQIRGPARLKSCLSCLPGTHAEEPPLQRTNAHPKTCPEVKLHCEWEVLIVTRPEAKMWVTKIILY